MRSMNTTGMQPSHDTPNDKELEKLREFTQTFPDRRDFEKATNPPILPPHLLQVFMIFKYKKIKNDIFWIVLDSG